MDLLWAVKGTMEASVDGLLRRVREGKGARDREKQQGQSHGQSQGTAPF
jgi:hypothetical protein